MTTVGYGDIVLQRATGKILAIVCGIVGLMFIGFVLESVTYEYHRLMKSNSQYLRYLATIKERDTVRENQQKILNAMRRVSSVHGSLSALSGAQGHNDCDVHVCINGAEFYFSLAELHRHPNSLLGHPAKRAQYYNPVTGSYFFPRNQDIFTSIQQYYRTPGATLQRPPFISMERFVEEIEFFQLKPQAVIDFFASEGIRLVEEVLPTDLRIRHWYMILEHHRYNLTSRLLMVITMSVTISFVLTIVLESLPALANPNCGTNYTSQSNGTSDGLTFSSFAYSSFTHGMCSSDLAFFIVETICTIWFVLELIARFYVSPTKVALLKKPMTWIDLLVTLPYIFTVAQLVYVANPSPSVARAFGFFRTMRLLRLVSVLKFSRYFKRIEMMFVIIRSTWSELLMLCYFMLINATVFGTVTYIFEYDPDGDFNCIPQGMYWAWITMLTIGYGDIVPKSTFGKIIGTGCAILGIVLWTLPMTLISDHFSNYRRLYEGQDFLMKCLTRMYHLRDSEVRKSSGCKVFEQASQIQPVLKTDKPTMDSSKRRFSIPVAMFGRLGMDFARRTSNLSNNSHGLEAQSGKEAGLSKLSYDGLGGVGGKSGIGTIGCSATGGFPSEVVQNSAP